MAGFNPSQMANQIPAQPGGKSGAPQGMQSAMQQFKSTHSSAYPQQGPTAGTGHFAPGANPMQGWGGGPGGGKPNPMQGWGGGPGGGNPNPMQGVAPGLGGKGGGRPSGPPMGGGGMPGIGGIGQMFRR